MEKKSKEYYEKVCRACLTESDSLKSLFSKLDGEYRTLAEALTSITNINYKFEGLPTQVCKTCEDIMYKTEAFKRLCIESEAALQEAINNLDKVGDNADLPSNPIIKHESDTDTGKGLVTCTFCMVKFKNLAALNSHVKSSHSGKKLDIFDQIASSSNSKETLEVKTAKKENIKSIKEEDNDDFEAADYGFELNIEIEPAQFGIDICKEINNDDIPLSKLLKRKKTKTAAAKPHKKFKTALPDGRKLPKLEPSAIKSEIVIDDGVPKEEKFCNICHIEFETLKQYKYHQRRHVKKEDKLKEKFQCPMCMRRFVKKSSLDAHLKTHDESAVIKYVCATCKREFQHQAHLDNHVLNVHVREKGFSCDICNKCFTTQDCLDIHKESHKSEKRHQCTQCSKSFVMLSTLTDHMRTHTGEKPFLCFQCGKGFSQKNNLAQHMRRHQGLKPFKCEICERGFVSKGELVAHNRKHSGAHPFICDDCGHGFTTSSSLVKHRRIHTGERPYACDLCSMRFAASGTLKNHRRTHTGEKPFQCSYCEKAFIQRQDLVSHIRCHTGERPFVCSTCGQPFRKASALKTHYKMHIKEPLQLQRDVNMTVLHNAILTGMQDELKI